MLNFGQLFKLATRIYLNVKRKKPPIAHVSSSRRRWSFTLVPRRTGDVLKLITFLLSSCSPKALNLVILPYQALTTTKALGTMISYHSSGQDVRTRRADETEDLITFERYLTVMSQSFAVMIFICTLPIADPTYNISSSIMPSHLNSRPKVISGRSLVCAEGPFIWYLWRMIFRCASRGVVL